MNILVIDVGTSSMRGLLFSGDGRLLTERQETYRVTYGPDGTAEQDPADWENTLYRITGEVVKAAAEKGQAVDALALTAQRSSVIPVDGEIRPLRPAIMWQDKRTQEICRRLAAENERVFSLCGSRVNPVFSGSKMTWIREHEPDLYGKTYKFLVIPDYLLYLVTGELVTDHTYGSRSLLMNLRTRTWDPELLELFRVEEKKLCKLTEPGTVCGKVTGAFAEKTGCPEGIPVVTAGGDQQCGAVGQGVIAPGVLSVTAGTGGFLITAADKVPEDLKPDVICNCAALPGKYVLESNMLACCSAFDWFCREFYPGVDYREIDRIAAAAPMGAGGCICLPYFQGRTAPDWNTEAKAVFSGVTLAAGRADLLRALMEGICYEIANGIDAMGQYVDIGEIHVNGGLTNSRPFNEIQCDVYGRKLVRRGKADATARGALTVAAAALGLYPSAREAFSVIDGAGAPEEQVYLPKEENVRFYREKRAEMNRLYSRIWG